MRIYHYDEITKGYVGNSEARIDPLQTQVEGVDCYLIPANATDTAPPAAGDREIAVFEAGVWVIKVDYREVALWSTLTKDPAKITNIGITPDATMTEIEPPDGIVKWDGSGWIADLAKIKNVQISALKASCEAACRAGWTSSALGAPHTYDTDKDRDQVTLMALAVAALQQIMLGNTLWTYDVTCTDGAGVKAMRPHTAAQLAQVGTEVQAMIAGHKQRYYTVVAELEAAFQAGDAEAMRVINFGGAI